MDLTYCYLCGTRLPDKSGESWTCLECGQNFYSNPKPCVEVVIFNNAGEVLLTKRGRDPFKGKLDMPGGFIDKQDDNIEAAALREMQEELSLDKSDLQDFHYIGSYTTDYPWGLEVYKVSVSEFMARTEKTDIRPSDDVEAVYWRKIADINPDELSVPQIGKMIDLASQEFKKQRGLGKYVG